MVDRFEDLKAWQKARHLVREVYGVTGQAGFSRDFGLRDQIRRASVSVMSNIAEGFERGWGKDFHRFLVVAKGSCAEVRSQLYVTLDVGYIDRSTFDELLISVEEVSRIIGGLRAAVAKRNLNEP